jgi:hypothetical protein
VRASPAAATAAAVLTAALVTGCGSTSGSGPGTSDPSGSGTPSVCGDATVTPGAGGAGHEVCLGMGSTLRLRLGAGERATERGSALTEVSPGVYRGARAGTAELSGFRRVCPSAAPGTVACHAIAGWTVTVRVR